jgi:hypothetical protein
LCRTLSKEKGLAEWFNEQGILAFDAGSNPVSVAVADFNRDGIPDLVVANQDSNNVTVLLGKGAGTFGAPVNSGRPGQKETGNHNRTGRRLSLALESSA